RTPVVVGRVDGRAPRHVHSVASRYGLCADESQSRPCRRAGRERVLVIRSPWRCLRSSTNLKTDASRRIALRVARNHTPKERRHFFVREVAERSLRTYIQVEPFRLFMVAEGDLIDLGVQIGFDGLQKVPVVHEMWCVHRSLPCWLNVVAF